MVSSLVCGTLNIYCENLEYSSAFIPHVSCSLSRWAYNLTGPCPPAFTRPTNSRCFLDTSADTLEFHTSNKLLPANDDLT